MSVAVCEMPCRVIDTTRFGLVEINEAEQVFMPEGLLGFESITEFVLIRHAPDSPFYWLQATADPALAFVTINPFDFFTEYDFTLGDADMLELGIHEIGDVSVLTLVTIRGKQVTTNLVGPVVMNWKTRMAKQVVLSDTRYGTRHSLLTESA